MQNLKTVTPGVSEGYAGEKTAFVYDPWDDLYDAMQLKEIRQGKVSGVENNDVVIFIGNVKGIIPEDEIGEPRPKRLTALVGQEIAFKVVRCDRANNVAYLSRKAALEEMSAATWQELKRDCAPILEIQDKIRAITARDGELFAKELSPEDRRAIGELNARAREVGPKRTATVRTVFREGAYVDIGGVSAFLPAHEVSWGRVDDARDVLKPGMSFDVRVIRVNFDSGEVRVSLKALLPDPWETVEKRYARGGTYSGTFLRVTNNNNPVVELEPGVTAVCNRLPLQRLKKGDRVRVKVSFVDPGRRYIRGFISGEQRWVS